MSLGRYMTLSESYSRMSTAASHRSHRLLAVTAPHLGVCVLTGVLLSLVCPASVHAQTDTATYDFATCTPGTDCFAYGTESKTPAVVAASRLGGTECNTVVSAGAYTALSASDATGGDTDPNRYTAPDPGGAIESCTVFEFELQQSEATITQIAITWEGYGDANDLVHLYVWDYSQGCYSDGQGTCMSSSSYNNPAAAGSGNADFTLTETITSNIANFVDEAAGNELTYLVVNTDASEDVFHDYTKAVVTYSVFADLTGTLSDGAVDALIVAGGETLIITLTNDTWDATIGADNAKTDALIAGIDSAQAEGTGWDAVVKANLDFNDVTRTSATVVTITLGAEASYAITANETITVTVPATALAGTNALVATPTFVIVTPTSFGYRKSITIDRTKVGTGTAPATLPNYPLLYSVTDADLKSTGNGGDVTSTSGHDILFRALDDTTCGGTSPCTLDHEIESYDPVTGQLVAWVRVPSVNTSTAGSDTVLYIYYGNSAIVTSIQDAAGVWDADHLMVQHHNEGSGTVTDSTQSDNDSNSQTGMTYGSAGKIGTSLLFDESDDYYTVGDFSYGDTFTVSMWLKVTDNTGSQYQYLYSHDAVGTNPSLNLYLHEDSVADPDDLEVRMRDSVASDETVLSDVSAGDANVTDGAWHHVTLTRVRNGTNTLYVDAVSQDTSTGPDTAIDPAGSINIGRREDGDVDRYFGGNLDEIRISDVERSADWVKTVYNNTNGPGDIGAADFYTVGSEVASPLTAVELVAFTATGYDRGVLLAWATGYEIDNLGFHVYREQAGERVALTASLIAGSGLLTQRGTAVTATQAYAWWDMAVRQTTPGLSYWLEDVDFAGTSTWHGPVTPVDGGHLIDVGPPAPGEGVAGPSSASLYGLATVHGATRQAFLTDDAPPWTRRGATNGSGTPLEAQWALAQQPAVKIGVRRTGWFRVTQAALVGAGLDPSVDPRRLQLFVNGVEQAITVSGEADGQFDATDSLGFYGEGVDTAYTDLRVYWVVSGASPGRRIGAASPPRPLAVTHVGHVGAATTAGTATDDAAGGAPPPPPAAAVPAREPVESSPPAAGTPETPAPAAAPDAPAPGATPPPAVAVPPARAVTAAREAPVPDARPADTAPAPARTAVAGRTPTPTPAAPAGPAAPRPTARAPLFVVAPPAATGPVARPRRPAASRGAERLAPPDAEAPPPLAADAPPPATGDDALPPVVRAVATRAVARQLELARAAGVPEAALEAILADYDPDGPLDASLQIALRLRTARHDARDAARPTPDAAADATAPAPDAPRSPAEETR